MMESMKSIRWPWLLLPLMVALPLEGKDKESLSAPLFPEKSPPVKVTLLKIAESDQRIALDYLRLRQKTSLTNQRRKKSFNLIIRATNRHILEDRNRAPELSERLNSFVSPSAEGWLGGGEELLSLSLGRKRFSPLTQGTVGIFRQASPTETSTGFRVGLNSARGNLEFWLPLTGSMPLGGHISLPLLRRGPLSLSVAAERGFPLRTQLAPSGHTPFKALTRLSVRARYQSLPGSLGRICSAAHPSSLVAEGSIGPDPFRAGLLWETSPWERSLHLQALPRSKSGHIEGELRFPLKGHSDNLPTLVRLSFLVMPLGGRLSMAWTESRPFPGVPPVRSLSWGVQFLSR